MTREEAKAFLNSVFPALSMKMRSAIKVLEQESCETTQMVDKSNFSQEQYRADLQSAFDCGKASAEPCEDAISRADTIEWLKRVTVTDGITFETGFKQILTDIQNMPSVTPKQKMSFDGMTNGEVIGLLFPGADIYHNRDFTLREMIFPDEWWDAPYKAESEDTE